MASNVIFSGTSCTFDPIRPDDSESSTVSSSHRIYNDIEDTEETMTDEDHFC